MRAIVSQRAAEQLAAAPDNVARTFFKQLAHLLRDRNHPSLDAKKYPESGDPELWQARITKAWRFYFRIKGDLYEITNATEHPK
jgi:mRNA interferase RelE/StbE